MIISLAIVKKWLANQPWWREKVQPCHLFIILFIFFPVLIIMCYFNVKLRGCLYEKKHPSYNPVNQVPRLAGMI